MFKLFNLYKMLKEKEKILFSIIFFGIFFSTFLEMISFSAIIPVFKLIFSGEKIDIPFLSDLGPIIILVLFLLLFLCKNLFLIFFHFFYIKFIFFFSSECSKKLFLNSLNQGYSHFKKNSSDFFLRKVSNDVMDMRAYTVGSIILMTEILFVTCLSGILFFINSTIFAFVAFFFSVTLALYYYLIKNRIKKWAKLNHINSGKLQVLVDEGLKGIKDVIIYNLQSFFYKKFCIYSDGVFESQFKHEFLNNILRYWMELLCVIIFSLTLIFLIVKNTILLNFLSIFALYGIALFRAIPSFNKIVMAKQACKFYYPGFKSVIDQLKTSVQLNIQNSVKNLNFEKCLELKNVSFKFEDTEKYLIKNFNLKIKKNSSTLIKGNNGSGKSTLVEIISGLRDPVDGDVIIDEKYKLKDCKINWMSKIGFVQQNVFIMNSSIIENIVLESSSYDQKKFREICSLIELDKAFENFDELVNKKNLGLDGFNLSGGQRQLISIARALYKTSEVLILDEPDSALDIEKNEILIKTLIKLRGIKTIIMISHNFSGPLDIFNNVVELSRNE
jgi:ABC-type bacteriocin/lantibiotic exporter with double-glycine peptidase domain